MQQPDFKFEILAFDNRYELSHAPIGWGEAEFQGEIFEKYKVVRRVFSSSLKYVLDAAKILRSVFFAEGIDGSARLVVYELNTDTYLYEEIFDGDFDFSTFTSDIDGVSIRAMERGVPANIAAYDDVVYEVPLDFNDEAVNINIGSLAVDEYADFTSVESNATSLTNLVAPSMIIEDDTTSDELAIPSNVTYYAGSSQASIAPFVSFGASLTVNFTGIAKVRIGTDNWPDINNIGRVYVFLKDSGNDETYLIKTLWYDRRNGVYQDFIVEINETVSVNEDSQFKFFYAYGGYVGGSYTPPGLYIDAKSLTFKLQYNAYEDDYLCKGLRPMSVFRSLMQQMNPGLSVECISNLLSQEPWNRLVVTSGDSLRAIPGAVIKTSFEDFFQSYDAELDIGLDIIGNTARIEQFSFFRNPFTRKAFIGEVKNLVLEPDLNYAYSSIEVGYENQEYRTLNGRDEQNTLESWSVTSTRVQKKKSIKSVYRADSRGIDQLIIDFRQNKTSDTKSDNEIFFLFLKSEPEEDGYYRPEGIEPYANVEGLASLDRSYNIVLSPRHMLMRHSAELAVQFALQKQGSINFESSAKNANMVLTYEDGSVFRERDSIDYTNMAKPSALPVLASFEAPITNAKFKEIMSNPSNYGYFEFTSEGKIYKGFPQKDSFVIEKNTPKTMKVLLTKDNSFTL